MTKVFDFLGIGIVNFRRGFVSGLRIGSSHIESQTMATMAKHGFDSFKTIVNGFLGLVKIGVKSTATKNNVKFFVKRRLKIIFGKKLMLRVFFLSHGNKFRDKIDTGVSKVFGFF